MRWGLQFMPRLAWNHILHLFTSQRRQDYRLEEIVPDPNTVFYKSKHPDRRGNGKKKKSVH
jgi:hypothetical protein